MERRKFTREFKLEAVRLIKERGVSYAQASHDLRVHQSQLRSWVKALAADPQHSFPGQGQMKPEQLEIAQLKREVVRLKAERDILKNAAAYFANVKDKFFYKVVDAQLDFERDAGGKVVAVVLHQNGRDMRAPRMTTQR